MANPAISDHALVRFVERVKGISLDGYRAEISELVAKPVRDGDGAGDDLMFVVEMDGTIVTVLTPELRPKHRKHNQFRRLVRVAKASVAGSCHGLS